LTAVDSRHRKAVDAARAELGSQLGVAIDRGEEAAIGIAGVEQLERVLLGTRGRA